MKTTPLTATLAELGAAFGHAAGRDPDQKLSGPGFRPGQFAIAQGHPWPLQEHGVHGYRLREE